MPPGDRPGEREFALAVRKQAQAARSRLIGADAPEADPANLRYARAPGRLRASGGAAIGDLSSVLDYYQSLSPRRLVVLGVPGAGKTVLLLELQILLLEARDKDPEQPVPVLISASACQTGRPWEDWLAGYLSLQFGIRERQARELIDGERILPLIDGLDEMDPAGDGFPDRAQALVRSVNAAMRDREFAPAVVTCRREEYDRLASDIDKATHVELAGLTGGEAAGYLRGQFRTADEQAAWEPVLETLERDPEGALAAQLATPWRLTMALATCRNGKNPADLLPSAALADPCYPARVDQLLLGGYVASAVSLHAAGTPYTGQQVQRWLTALADDLAWQARRGRSATDIVLHDWWRPAGSWRTQASHAVLAGLPILVILALDAITGGVQDADVTVPVSVAYALAFALAALRRTRPGRLRPRVSRRRVLAGGIRTGLTAGLASGLFIGLVAGAALEPATPVAHRFGPSLGLAIGLLIGLAAGAAAGVAAGLAAGMILMPVLRLFSAVAGRQPGPCAGVIAGGLAGGLAGALAGASLHAHPAGLGLAGLAAGGFTGGFRPRITSGPAEFSPEHRRPRAVLRADGCTGLIWGLTVALLMPAAGVPLGSGAFLLLDVLELGLVAIAVLAVVASAWTRYHVTVAWNALRGRGPWRFGKFLDWAAEAGLLRESGVAYQFRHRQLQDWLTSPAPAGRRREPTR